MPGREPSIRRYRFIKKPLKKKLGSRLRGNDDAARGWAKHAPYQVIVLTGSTPVLARAFLEQLEVGGRLFAVVGELPVMSARLVTCTAPGAYHTVDLFETVVAPLVNAEQPPRFRF